MKQDGGLSFETQLKIEFLLSNNGSKKCLEKSLHRCFPVNFRTFLRTLFYWNTPGRLLPKLLHIQPFSIPATLNTLIQCQL